MLTNEEKRELELHFLNGVREGVALDVAAAEKGGMPRKWDGNSPLTPQQLEQLRHHLRNVEAAIKHAQRGGNLDDTPYILWGRKPPR